MKNIFLFSLFLILSCTSSTDSRFSDDRLLNQIFSKNEIQGLESLVKFYDNHVMEVTKVTQLDIAYHMFFDSLKFTDNYYELYSKLEYDSTVIDSLMVGLKGDGVWESIYMHTYGLSMETYDTIAIYTEPNRFSKYMILLDSLSENSEFHANIKRELEEAGSMFPPSSWGYPYNHMSLDFNDIHVRLLCAIEMLTLPDPYILDK